MGEGPDTCGNAPCKEDIDGNCIITKKETMNHVTAELTSYCYLSPIQESSKIWSLNML